MMRGLIFGEYMTDKLLHTFRAALLGLAFLAFATLPAQAQQADTSEVRLLEMFHDIYWMDPRLETATAEKPATDMTCSSAAALSDDADALVASLVRKRPVIAIVIDDVGLDRKRSDRAVRLPANVTLAFLPYAGDIRAQTAAAARQGHELMVHLPMEPDRATVNPGKDHLRTEHTADELKDRIGRNLDAFDGYAGVNNHMGSKFTRHAPGLKILMTALKKRGVYFLDSKTAPDSVAENIARGHGISTTHRDVFIDHFEDRERVLAALAQTERIAAAKGSAVAIGHPKDVTLQALEEWLPTLAEKGFDLVPMSQVIALRAAHGTKLAAE